jgi:hypothetical protein
VELQRIGLAIVGCGLFAALGLGCSSDDANAASGGTGGTAGAGGAAGGGGSAGQGSSVEVVVTEPGLDGSALGGAPLANATVAVELPGGTRVELATDANGKVTVDGIDWSQGRLAITGYAKDHLITSWVGIASSDVTLHGGFLPLPLMPNVQDTITVSGSLKNASSAQSTYSIYSSGPQLFEKSNVTSYSLQAHAKRDFSIFAIEHVPVVAGRTLTDDIKGWIRTDGTSSESDVQQDLDFATPLPTKTVSGKVMLPTKVGGSLQNESTLFVFVCPVGLEGSLNFGWATHTQPNTASDAADYTLQYVEPTDFDNVLARYHLRYTTMSPGGSWISEVNVPGYPSDGATVEGFLDQFTVTKPSAGSAIGQGDALEFTTQDADTSAALVLSRSGKTVWLLFSSELGAASLRIPQLPSTATADGAIGGGALSGTVTLRAEYDASNFRYRRFVSGPSITVQP